MPCPDRNAAKSLLVPILAVTLSLFACKDTAQTVAPAAEEQVATPTFSLAAGAVASQASVTISCATAGASISYSTDGATYSIGASYTITDACTLYAKATKSGYADSAVASAAYTIKDDDPAVVPPIAATGKPDPSTSPDGWAKASGAPTSPGGYGASAANTYSVSTRSAFIDALRCGGSAISDTAKIIYVDGMIDLCADDSDASLDAYDFLTQAGYGGSYPSYEDYQSAYIAGCSSTGVNAAMSAVRSACYARQKNVVVVNIGSNTSILGIGAGSGFKNGRLYINGKTNIVIRNVSVLDAYDYFPAWDYGDSGGMMNSEYDNITIVNAASYIWVDHCSLSDGDRPDSTLPWYSIDGVANAKEWVTHDGLLDVTNGSNYVTISWNVFGDHNKTSLIGGSDSNGGTGSTNDTDKLKVTFHHNYYRDVVQRLPRVRFGQVHVYNNYYSSIGSYAIGVGDRARIYSEANYFDGVAKAFAAYDDASNEGYWYDSGSVGVTGIEMDTAALVGWTPSSYYSYSAETAEAAKASVLAGAGAGKF